MEKINLNLDYNIRPSNLGIKGSTPIFLIHGYGANKDDLFSFESYLPVNLTVIALQAPLELPYGGAAWYSLEMMGGRLISDVDQAKQAMSKVEEFIDQAIEKYELKGDNKFVLGFSQGAILSCALMLNKPEKFKYMLPLSGYILDDLLPENHNRDYSHLQVYAAHGNMDGVIPIEKGRSVRDKLESLNIQHQYREFDAGHSIAQREFEELLDWIKLRII